MAYCLMFFSGIALWAWGFVWQYLVVEYHRESGEGRDYLNPLNLLGNST
jgi:hypothetical protein